MTTRIHLLLKIFNKEEYADAFIQKGELFCQTLGYFKRIENGGMRGDAYEAVTGWHQPSTVSLTLTFTDKDGAEKTIPIEDLAGPVVVQSHGYDRLNLYCMYAVKTREFEESYETEEERVRLMQKINTMLYEARTLPEEALSLGEFAVVVYRVQTFIEKVRSAAKQDNLACWSGLIRYYDPDTFNGSFEELETIFRKRNTYEHQNEYRFAFGSHGPEGSRKIHLGSLHEIAIKMGTKDVNRKLQLTLAEKPRAA